MTVAYCSSVAHAAVTQWAATTAYSVGHLRRQLAAPTAGNERVFRCTTAGTSGGAEPSWNLTNNSTTNDGSAVWTAVTGQAAYGWNAPFSRVASAISVLASASGDTIYVASNHAESNAAAVTVGSGAGSSRVILSVNASGSVPPVAADLLAGASIATTGANSITVSGVYGYGLTLSAGSGSSNANITFNSIAALSRLEACALIINTTHASGGIFSSSTFKGDVQLVDTTLTLGAAGQQIQYGAGTFQWLGGSLLGTAPSTLFTGAGGNATTTMLDIRGVDLSNASGALMSATAFYGRATFVNCKLHASVTMPVSAGAMVQAIRVHNCDDSSANRNYRFTTIDNYGRAEQSILVARDGGASDGVTAYSMRLVAQTGTVPTLYSPWRSEAISKRINATGSPVTLTIHLLHKESSAFTDALVWAELEALESSASPVSTHRTTRAASPLSAGSTLSASTETWEAGTAAARANSTAYTVGDIIKVAAGPGTLYYCTASGTSAGSQPGAYATAVDGDAITDGGATFRAMWRHKLAFTFTPARKGTVRAVVCLATSAGAAPYTQLYVCPKLEVA